ncbi:MAG: tRNA (guanosine(46)-N7)-methyltransferase TrmB [Pseudomonadales bacterium]|nr:tRNA (guanosine(46)-N7)-methyltransferase TrmB [Pseudomonadales bacterium]NNL11848.1 tRNA (guanosine(46)-N7)-methyltransferase TrmB [Pseudomonadales bacterium]NNM11112.1 tRNA (guanosine(46)-N7)-methyltransferase TrmB [Pseudomonadales bacterium]RZV60253.1 MAG: tRNA (guanosine(46)-N7)-methyltransferase TrmB [Pseudomonadales bacterium]
MATGVKQVGSDAQPLRRLRSFVLRSGRITESQARALQQHMQRWALPRSDRPVDFSVAFGNDNPVTMEIGFGMGDSLAQMAGQNPAENFLGVEVHRAGVGRLLALVEKNELGNVRVYCDDAVEVLEQNIAARSLARVNIFFPDPWHKKRHHKRRLVQAGFLDLLHSKLEPDGLLHIATDWQPYAEHVLEVVAGHDGFENINAAQPFANAADYGRPETKFERRGIKLGHGVWDMVFRPKT